MLILLAICGVLSTLFLLVLLSAAHVAGAPDMTLALLFWPFLVGSVFGLMVAISWGCLTGRRAFFGVAVLFLPLILDSYYELHSYDQGKQEQTKRSQAANTASTINSLLFRYHKLHPERFHYIATDDEVAVDGFTDFARSGTNKLSAIQVRDGQFLDPWGRIFHLALNRGKEKQISVCGRSYFDQTKTGWVVATVAIETNAKETNARVIQDYGTFSGFAASQ